jgi:transcriptional regulator with XRE-family HTH domain
MNGSILKEKLQLIDIQFVELSKKLNISPQSLQSRLKSKDISISFLVEICRAINKSPYYFLKGTEYESYFKLEETGEVSEPRSNYANSKDLDLIKSKDKIIELLEYENQRLKDEVAELKGLDKSRTA